MILALKWCGVVLVENDIGSLWGSIYLDGTYSADVVAELQPMVRRTPV